MILHLKHEPVGGGVPQFTADIEAGRHIIGRDEENSLVLDIESVSREHGSFFEARGRWFYSDLGSTNGSWVNGAKTGPDSIRLLRDGDLVQLANVAVRVRLEDETGGNAELEEVPSLFIFRNTDFQMEFPLSATSSRLSLPDLQNYVSIADYERLPEMTVTLRGGKLELVVATESARILFNGVEWGGAAGAGRTLYDRDELDAGAVKLVVSDLATAKAVRDRQIKAALATLPPAPGVPSAGSSPLNSLSAGSSGMDATNTLPRISSQSEPSATMGSGSGLFSGKGPGAVDASVDTGFVSGTNSGGGFAASDFMPDQESGRRGSQRGGIYDTPQDAAPSEEAAANASSRQRSLYTGGGNTTETRGLGSRNFGGLQGGEIGSSQRFGQPLPQEEEEEEFESSKRSKSQIIVGFLVIILVIVVFGVVISIFRGG